VEVSNGQNKIPLTFNEGRHARIQYRSTKYSQTCIKRSPLEQRKSGLIRQVTSSKRFNSYEFIYDRTRKRWPLKAGDCLIEVTTWVGLTVHLFTLSIDIRNTLEKKIQRYRWQGMHNV